MNLPFLASFLIFILVFTFSLHRRKNKDASAERAFWEREREANAVRKKSLENLDYIHIPLDMLPTQVLQQDPKVAEILDILKTLSSEKIVNLTGYTNTDLKLEYGAPNITALTQYDSNYTLLVCYLQKWADILLQNGFTQEAEQVMEFAMSTHTDVSRTYYQLAKIYADRNETPRIQRLIETSQSLRSANKNAIARTLRESYL